MRIWLSYNMYLEVFPLEELYVLINFLFLPAIKNPLTSYIMLYINDLLVETYWVIQHILRIMLYALSGRSI